MTTLQTQPPTLPPNGAAQLNDQQALRRATVASFIGNFVEWFDYAAYGYLAAVIAVVFFPETDKTTGLLAAFAVFAISFVIRPIGGIVWGHWGDKFGRRAALSLSILIMSGATFLIAFLPTYQQVGVWSPILLLLVRLVQGFSASGEYAGASAFLAEYAPKGKRGFYTSVVPASTATGLLLGSLLVALLHAVLTPEQMQQWGWRLPFLLAAPFGLIGRYIRLHLQDTPKFREMEGKLAEKEKETALPIKQLLTTYRKKVLIACGVVCLNAVAFYMMLSYMPTYLSVELNVSETLSFISSSISLAAYIGFVFFMGYLSDHHGRKTMLVSASVLFIILAVPLFKILGLGHFWAIVLVQIVFGALLAMNDGTLPCFLSEIFPTPVRYSGFAFSFNTGNAIMGGTAPLVSTWLISLTGSKLAPAWYLVAIAMVALVAMLMSHETFQEELPD